MSQEFQCYRCDGQSIVLPDELDDHAHVTCRNCGALHGTLGELRQLVIASQTAIEKPATFSGC